MNELSAAVLNVQLGKLDRILSTLRANKTSLRQAHRVDTRVSASAGSPIRTATPPRISSSRCPTPTLRPPWPRELGTKTLADVRLARLRQHGASPQPAHRVGIRQRRRRLCCRAWSHFLPPTRCSPDRSPSVSASSTPVSARRSGSTSGPTPTDIEQVAERFRTAVERHVG